MKTLLNVLKDLVDVNAKFVYNKRNYKVINKKVEDNFNMFVEYDEQMTEMKNNVIFNEKELNVSIRNKVKGYVRLNPKQAAAVGLAPNVEAIMFRNHAIVKNGELNVKTIKVIINENLLKDYLAEGIVLSSERFNDERIVELDLTQLPIANCNMQHNELLKLVKSNNMLKAEQKVLKYYQKSNFDNTAITNEQTELLAEYGVVNGVYNGIDNVAKEEGQYYMAKNIILQIKGEANIPSVNALLKVKTLKGLKLYMMNCFNEYKTLSNEEINEKLNEVNSKIMDNNFRINEFRINEINNTGFEYSQDDTTLVVKVAENKHYF